MRPFLRLIIITLLISCSEKEPDQSVELVADRSEQSRIFTDVISVAQNFSSKLQKDSIVFLLLPLQAICASCRDKIIDSIAANYTSLDDRHFIIVSASGGKKTMSAFFRERRHQLPIVEGKIFLDSLNKAKRASLFTDKPVIFYCYNEQVYKKVSSIPQTVKKDLNSFFSACRHNSNRNISISKKS
jgi:hypothetical protein